MEKYDIFGKAAEYLEDDGYEAEVRENYSGRGMYGRETVGIVTSAPGTMVGAAVCKAMVDLYMYDKDMSDADVTAEDMQDFLEDEMTRMMPKSMDSMGLDKIYY